MNAPTTVPFRLVLDIPSNDLAMLEQLAELERCTVRELLIATLQGSLAARAETVGLSYRRGWHDAHRLGRLLTAELDYLHAGAQAGLTAQQVLDGIWPPES